MAQYKTCVVPPVFKLRAHSSIGTACLHHPLPAAAMARRQALLLLLAAACALHGEELGGAR